jgi:hypothetical protein
MEKTITLNTSYLTIALKNINIPQIRELLINWYIQPRKTTVRDILENDLK